MYIGEGLFRVDRPAGDTIKLNIWGDISLEIIWCPPGEFMMGNPEEDAFVRSTYKPQIKVRLTQGFWISRHLIILEVWLLFMGKLSASRMPAENYPAATVSWDDAREFCRRLSGQIRASNSLSSQIKLDLPTEAQWEYACRAGTQTRWHFGDDVSLLKDYAWYADNSNDQEQLIGQKLPNPWGIYDLYGNVGEWCLDDHWYWKKAIEEKLLLEDPLYRDTEHRDGILKTLRGGYYYSRPDECCSASTVMMSRFNSYNDPTGVRVVMSRQL